MEQPEDNKCSTCPEHSSVTAKIGYILGGAFVSSVFIIWVLSVFLGRIENAEASIKDVRSMKNKVTVIELNLKRLVEHQGLVYIESSHD